MFANITKSEATFPYNLFVLSTSVFLWTFLLFPKDSSSAEVRFVNFVCYRIGAVPRAVNFAGDLFWCIHPYFT